MREINIVENGIFIQWLFKAAAFFPDEYGIGCIKMDYNIEPGIGTE